MKIIGIIVVILMLVVSAGCTQSDTQLKVNPGWDNMPDVTPSTTVAPEPVTPHESIAFAPLVTSDAYIAPQRSTIIMTPLSRDLDPIVGLWRYSGDAYQCDAEFYLGGNGYAACSAGLIPLGTKTFEWAPAASPYSWMRNYTLTEIPSNTEYIVFYSERNGGISSDIIPDGGYLIKVR